MVIVFYLKNGEIILNSNIKDLLNAEREFDTFDEAKQKVTQFINE